MFSETKRKIKFPLSGVKLAANKSDEGTLSDDDDDEIARRLRQSSSAPSLRYTKWNHVKGARVYSSAGIRPFRVSGKDQEAFIHCPDLSVNIHAVFKKLFTEVNAVQNYCVLSYGKSTHQVPFFGAAFACARN